MCKIFIHKNQNRIHEGPRELFCVKTEKIRLQSSFKTLIIPFSGSFFFQHVSDSLSKIKSDKNFMMTRLNVHLKSR